MDKQQLFDTVWERAKDKRKAGAPVLGHDFVCRYRYRYRYRAPDGEVLKCFIGAAIPDDKYHPAMEGDSVHALVLEHDFGSPVSDDIAERDAFIDFADDIQDVHDKVGVDYWEGELRKLGYAHGLTVPPQET